MEFLTRIKKPKFDEVEELRFLENYREEKTASARLIQIQIIIIFLGAGYLDYLLLGDAAPLVIFARYILVMPVLLLIAAFSFTHLFKRFMQHTFVVAMGLTSCYLTLFTLLNSESVALVYFVAVILMIFVGFVYVPMLFKPALFLSVFIFALSIMALLNNNNVSSEIMKSCVLLLMGCIVLALAGCYSNERSARLDFRYRDMLSEKNDALQESNFFLQILADFDGLTGIPNRRAFDEKMQEEWQRADRSGCSISVMLMDVDFFKAYNDYYGHQDGDECLKKIAQTLQSTMRRAGDFVARYGGEEFVFIVSNSEPDKLLGFADTLRYSIEALAIPHEQSKIAKVVTISIGVASIFPNEYSDGNVEHLIRAADRALYQAKLSGRNQVAELEAAEA